MTRESDIHFVSQPPGAFRGHRTLILNPDYRPSSFPLTMWSAEDTVNGLVLGAITPVIRSDVEARSPSTTLRLPSVAVLRDFAHPHHLYGIPRPTAQNVYIRDRGRCGYMGTRVWFKAPCAEDEATLDHVYPRSRGGGNTWKNLVIANKKTNNTKGCRTPKEADLALRYPLWKPTGYDLLCLLLVDRMRELPEDWQEFLHLKPSKRVARVLAMEPAA